VTTGQQAVVANGLSLKPNVTLMRARFKRITFLLLYLLPFFGVRAQSSLAKWDNLSLTVQRHFGSFITNAPKASYVRDSYSAFTEIAISRQTNGSQRWHRWNNYPRAGLGLAFGNIGSKQYVGKVASIYPFVSFPIARSKAFVSLFRLGTGISAVEKPYDIQTNHKNTLVGSRFNNYIHLSVDNEFRVSKPIQLTAGISFAHISNGNIKLPNYGLNFVLLSGGLRYKFGERVVKDSAREHFGKTRKIRFMVSAGAKQTPWIGSPRYGVGVVSTEIVQTLSPADAVGIGVDAFLDPSLSRDPSGFVKDNSAFTNVQVGLHAFYERAVGRVTIPVQAGVYVINGPSTKRLYQTIGLRYKVTPQLQLFYHLKTHGGKADFLHFGLGYTL
jgi:hypothetical protein